jgi:hypothetical protein
VPRSTSLAIASAAVLVPRAFLAADDLADAIDAGEVVVWSAPTLGGDGAAEFAALTPYGAALCKVTADELGNLPVPASVPEWYPVGLDLGAVREPATVKERRDARKRVDATPEPWRAILDLCEARRELSDHHRPEPKKPMPAKRKSTKPKRKGRRKTRVGSTRKI